MKIIGCDFHPSEQQIAMLDRETGELSERRMNPAEAGKFYESLRGEEVLVGVETSGNMVWFERLLARCGHQLWIGDAAKIRAAETRYQKTDKRDAGLLLQLLLENRFPRLWVPSLAERDLRQLVMHRHKWVRMREVKNQLQHMALNQGIQRKQKLWSQAGRQLLANLELEPWTKFRRDSLLQCLEHFEQDIGKLDGLVEKEAGKNPLAVLLMSHPGVGPVISLATVLTLGEVSRFQNGKRVASYLGLVPKERSSGARRRLGSISKQGNPFLRHLLVEGAQTAIRGDKQWAREYQHLVHKKHRTGEAKVMIARKLVVRLYWMLRTNTPYPEIVRHARQPESSCGRKRPETLSGHLASQSKRP